MLPTQIGRFQIISQIGENERGFVYRAFDPQLQREVAVKLLKSQYLYTLTATRNFTAEAEKLRQLQHPAILPVYDYGDEDNRPFLAMPLLTGGNLAERLSKSGPLSLKETLEVFTPIAAALDHAAAHGLIHQDLKPGNILFDQNNRPFLTDLGLMQIIDALTSAKAPRPNPHYISPEQVRDRELDARTHVYGLGAILYEVLTGKPLFSGASEMVTAFKHVSELPRPPRTWRPELPEAAEAVLLHAVEKHPDDRFQTAQEFLAALERSQGGSIPPGALLSQTADRTLAGAPTGASAGIPDPAGQPDPSGWTFEPEAVPAPARKNQAPLVLGMAATAVLICALLVAALLFVASTSAPGYVETAPGIPSTWTTSPNLDSVSTQAALLATETAAAFAAETAQAEATQIASQATAQLLESYRTQALAWPVLMADSFDQNLNDWAEEETVDENYAAISWSFLNGQYVWRATAYDGFVWRVWPDIDAVGDFYLSVQVQRNSGTDRAQYGLIFRNSEQPGTYYYFEVRETQEFAVYLYNGTEWVTLLPLSFSEAIVPGQVNQLEVIAQGHVFLFFINGEYVGEVSDSSLPLGEVGLAIGLPDPNDQAVIVFDNFEVRAP